MSENQAGGTKNSAITVHILILQTTIKEIRKKKKTAYMVLLHVSKAYDKTRLDAVINAMHKEGRSTPEWNMVKKLNENIKAKIQTKYRETRAINIKESIIQGGVLSVAQYALLMSQINKEISKQDLGTYIPDIEETIGCLLWMDDVVLITSDQKEPREC